MAAESHDVELSVEAYLSLDRASLEARYEYLDGHVRMMSGGTLNHSSIAMNLQGILRERLRGSDCRVYNSDARVRLAATQYVYPDATVTCDAADLGTGDIISSPRLVVEVLSPGTESYDRGRKAEAYRACPTLEEYVMVDAQRQRVEIQRRVGALWHIQTFGPGEQVELASLAVSFPLATLYADMTLPDNM